MKYVALLLLLCSCASVSKKEAGARAVFDLTATPSDTSTAYGLGLYGYRTEHRVGMYFNMLATLEHREDYDFAGNPFDDPVVGEERDIWAFNVGPTLLLVNSDHFAWGAFAGVGYAGSTTYAVLDDPTGILNGPDGVYHVQTEEESGLNVNLGTHFLINRAAIGLSYNTQLQATSFHIGVAF